MDSLKDLLLKKDIEEPSELKSLREYCEQFFNFTPKLVDNKETITLYAPSGPAASELRIRQAEIQRRCQLTRKLFIRIGSL